MFTRYHGGNLWLGIWGLVAIWPTIAFGDDLQDLLLAKQQFETHFPAGRFNEAAAAAQTMVTLAERSFANRDDIVGVSLKCLGYAKSRLNQNRAAADLFERALACDERKYGRTSDEAAETLIQLAQARIASGQGEQAIDAAKRAVELKEDRFGKQDVKVLTALSTLSGAYHRTGQFALAIPPARRGLEIAEHNGDDDGVRSMANNLAAMYRSLGQYAEAEPLFQRALGIARRMEKPPGRSVALMLNNLGSLYFDCGRYEESLLVSIESVAIYERLMPGNHPEVATAISGLANVYSSLGRYSEAAPLFERAIAMYEAVDKQHPDLAIPLDSLALMYSVQGRNDEAVKLYRRAYELLKQSGQQGPAVATNLSSLAAVLSELGQFDEAERLTKQALEMKRKLFGDMGPGVAETTNNLAEVYADAERYDEAVPLFEQAIRIWQSHYGDRHAYVGLGYSNLGLMQLRRGKLDEARSAVEQAIKILDERQAAAFARSNARAIAAQINWAAGRRDAALADVAKAIELIELQRANIAGGEREQAKAMVQTLTPYELAIRWSAEMDQPERTLQFIERSRSRTLIDQLGAAHVDLLAGLEPRQAEALRSRERTALTRQATLARRWRQLKNSSTPLNDAETRELDQVELELPQAREGIVAAYTAMRNASPAFRRSLGRDFEPASAAQLQQLLDEHGLLLEYAIGNQDSHCVVLKSQGPSRVVALTVDAAAAAALGVEPGPLVAPSYSMFCMVLKTYLTCWACVVQCLRN